MELRDIYDRYKHKTGNIHQRGNPMKEGEEKLLFI